MIERREQINGIEVEARFSERAVNEIFLPMLNELRKMQKARGRREPDREYTGWEWRLARTADGGWQLLTRGYR